MRELYKFLDTLVEFFETFKDNQNNPISINKTSYIDYFNKLRLLALEKLVREE